MKKTFALFAVAALMTSCFERKNPPIIFDETETVNTQTMDSVFEDTTKILKVELPILLDSANQILAHEVFVMANQNKRYSKISKSEYTEDQRINLIFEDQINGKSYLLTDKQIQIMSYNVIVRSNLRGSQGLIMYNVIDADYNNDGMIDYMDIRSIYIGNITGTTFNKITKDREQFVEGKWLTSLPQNRYYFTTREDSNKDGYFGRKDAMHYYYIEFDGLDYQVTEYNPLDMIAK